MAARPDTVRTPELVDALVELTFAVHDVLTRVSAEFDLSVTQLRLLGMLRDRTPPMTAIADHLGLDRSSVTGLIDRAERRGLVARRTSTSDARVTEVRATARAVRLGRRLAATVTEEMEALVRQLSPAERAALMRVARAVLETPDQPLAVGEPGQGG